MKKFFAILMASACLSSPLTFASEINYRCEGTPGMTEIFGDIVFVLTEDVMGDFALSLDFGNGSVVVDNAQCEFDGRMTGIPGLITLECTDSEGVVLPVTFNRNDLSLIAEFPFPGGISGLILEANCTADAVTTK